jgi:hypothetical protein
VRRTLPPSLDLPWCLGPLDWRTLSIETNTDDGGSGGSGQTDPPPPASSPAGGGSAPTLTQADVDRAAKQAVKDAEKAMGEKYGMTPEQAKKLADERKAAEDAAKDDVTKAQEAAKAREDAADARERAADVRERAASVRAALLAANVRPDRLTMAERVVAVPADADDDGIAAAVETFKTSTPEWFPAPGQPNAPGGLPGSGRHPAANQNPTGIQAGRDRAKRERESASNRPAFGAGLTVIGGSAS